MIKNIAVLLLFFISFQAYGQLCNGSLGENIFERGDFGSGTSNNVMADPGIAPGYMYTTNPPPGDGLYILTNNTGAWTNLYPTWIRIRDNSSDPNGYMMVVNASFSPGNFYEEIIDGLCPSTFYEFSADVINLIRIGTTNHIDPNIDFLLDDITQYTTGVIPKTERWETYGFTFTSGPSQTSIKLTLKNNAPGGIGNDLALDNISFRACGAQSFIGIDTEETIFLCEEDDPLTLTADIIGADGEVFSIQWQRSLDEEETWENIGLFNSDTVIHSLFRPGNYAYRYLSASSDVNLDNVKCRVLSDIIRIEVLPKIAEFRDTICDGLIYTFGNQELTVSGMYSETFQSSLNCDSIAMLDLYFIPDPDILASIDVIDPRCNGDENGQIIITDLVNGVGPYSFFLNDVAVESSNLDLDDGQYQVRIIDKFGCSKTFPIELLDPELFMISTIGDQEVLLGDEIMVTTESNFIIVNAVWTPNAGLSCDNCPNPIIIASEDTEYQIQAENENGCIDSDAFNVKVNVEELVFIPNIFSPNNDGINDIFHISSYKNSVEEIDKIVIYDRWGSKIFNKNNIGSNNLNDGWSPDNSVSEGVYSYVVNLRLINGTEIIRVGDITLIR